MYRALFALLAAVGRPFGGLSRRAMHWLANRAYPSPPSPPEFRWVRDCWGSEFFLHPYFYYDHQIIAAGCYDRPLHRFLDREVKPGMVALDVGAHFGEVALHMARLGADVIAFEPIPRMADLLEANASRNGLRVTCRRQAVGDRVGRIEIDEVAATERNQGLSSLGSQTGTRVKVDCTTLDELRLARVDLIKIDVEGAEALVVAGAMATLKKFRPIVCIEVIGRQLARFGVKPAALLRTMQGLGYGCFDLDGAALDVDRMADDVYIENVVCR